jgi:spore germination protein KB
MNIEKGKIANSQLLLLIIGFIDGSIFLTSYVSGIAKNNTWLVIIAALACIIPFVFIAAWLGRRFPGLNFAQINRTIYGPYIGTAVSLLYLSHFWIILASNIQDLGGFYVTFFMRDTPLEVFVLIFTFACAYAIWNGIEVLARIAPFIVAIVSAIIIISTLMLIDKMDFTNFLPIGDLPLIKFLHATQIIASQPFGEVVMFLPAFTFVLNDYQDTIRTAILGLLVAGLFFLIISIRNTAVLGGPEGILTSPSYQVVRLISLGVLTRMDILFALGHTLAMFLKCCLMLYATILFISQLLGLKTYSPLVFPLGCTAVILALIIFPSVLEAIEGAQSSSILWTDLYVFFFPALSFLIAKIRGLPKKGNI